ncbi:ImmA/IrrE family metallo-endopeptidase [Paeniglutamicibacter sp. NPDC091659]|uniref:ImmA/IrrE family metallo-endopeptidase n=1 Tax=Paeniglutamicibacter sp. NPDC091659 TaxID=3364389 RepID=UPI00380C1638
MVERVEVAPMLFAWARQRAGKSVEDLLKKFPQLPTWESGEALPTMRQLEKYAEATYTPVGYFFLPEPLQEDLPVPDFRTIGNVAVQAPSADLLETIYICERRQDWYLDYAARRDLDPLEFVGSVTTRTPIADAAAQMGEVLGLNWSVRNRYEKWEDALFGLAALAEDAGILVMISGIVGSNTHRILDPNEFRGFALADATAPLVFVNGTDTKAAQIFTLAHELAHVWLGQSAVSLPDLHVMESNAIEKWCNSVAAELLVPLAHLRTEYRAGTDLTRELDRLARVYKVSTLVVLRRIFDLTQWSWDSYSEQFEFELDRVMGKARRVSSGGDYYNTQQYRLGKRFIRALVADTMEGGTLHRHAFELSGSHNPAVFHKLGEKVGAF